MSDSNERFAELVRAALKALPERKVSPRPESILAYLEGSASEEQSAEVQSALADSSEFQQLFLDIANTIHALSTAEAGRDFAQTRVPRMPLVEAHIRRRRGIGVREWLGAVLDKLTDLFSLRILVPVGATVAVALLAFLTVPSLRFWHRSATLSRYTELDPSFFAGGVERGRTSAGDDSVASKQVQAACAGFRRCITLDPATHVPRFQPYDTMRAERFSRRVVLCLIDATTGDKQIYSASVPPPDQTRGKSSVEAWVIYLPSLEVWNAPMTADSVDVQLSPGAGTRGCVVFAYPVQGGYRSTVGGTFEIKP